MIVITPNELIVVRRVTAMDNADMKKHSRPACSDCALPCDDRTACSFPDNIRPADIIRTVCTLAPPVRPEVCRRRRCTGRCPYLMISHCIRRPHPSAPPQRPILEWDPTMEVPMVALQDQLDEYRFGLMEGVQVIPPDLLAAEYLEGGIVLLPESILTYFGVDGDGA